MAGITGSEDETPQQFAVRLQLPFKDNRLLSRALTHRSYRNEHSEALEDNERLEFLGDAVLDFMVGAWLYNHFPEMPEGDLTRMRSALVHTEQLAQFARTVGLGHAMRLGRGEIQTGGKERSALLCDTFEALVGALYLDAGLEVVGNFIYPLIESAADYILETHQNEDPKSQLQEWAQGHGYMAPTYITRSANGPDHAKVFEMIVMIGGEVFGAGEGHSKQLAAKAAARDALVHLGLPSA